MSSTSKVGVLQETTSLENIVYKKVIDDEEVFFVPAYSALVFKLFDNIDLKAGRMSITFTFILRFYVDGLCESDINLLTEGLKLRVGEKEIHLGHEEATIERKTVPTNGKPMVVYIWRACEEVVFEANMKWTPFDLPEISLDIELTHLYNNDTQHTIRFNLHTCLDQETNISFKDPDKLPEFNVAYNKTTIHLHKESKRNK